MEAWDVLIEGSSDAFWHLMNKDGLPLTSAASQTSERGDIAIRVYACPEGLWTNLVKRSGRWSELISDHEVRVKSRISRRDVEGQSHCVDGSSV